MRTSPPKPSSKLGATATGSSELAEILSNARVQDNTFTVEEKVKDGKITYKLPLNDFLGIENKTATRGTGFCDSQCTKDIRQDEADPYVIKYDARSQADVDDWTTQTCNLRPHLKLKHGMLFGGDAAPAMVVEKGAEGDVYEVSAAEARTFVEYEKEEAEAEASQPEGAETESYHSHPDHKIVFQPGPPEGQVVANGMISDGNKLVKLIRFFIDGNPHPGKRRYRTDAKGHRYFGCEKCEHFQDGTFKTVCT